MENGSKKRWGFQGNQELNMAAAVTIRGVLGKVMSNLSEEDNRPVIPLGHGDPSAFPCFRTTPVAEDAIADAVRSAKFNSYAPTVGLLPARSMLSQLAHSPLNLWPYSELGRTIPGCHALSFVTDLILQAVAEYLSRDLPYQLSPDDIYLTIGCTQAIEIMIQVLARPGANILLPRPGFPYYEARAAADNLEVRHFDLLPEQGWEVDLEAVKALADENTVAMVIVNPGNPSGSVFTYEHLKKVAETARNLGIMVISDEVYGHLAFGSKPFVPMGVFGSIVPIVTVGSISKRWVVPGWRLGWLVTNDLNGILHKSGVVESIISCLNISSDPATFIQGAIPEILEKTKEDFFSNTISILRECADIIHDRIKGIPCITCPQKPEGSMFVMVKLNLSLLEDIDDDVEFCMKLSKEESVIVLPGVSVGMKNWLRVTFAIDPPSLKDGLGRIKVFYQRHAKKE
ncbi:Tyrosine aminotransferase [Vitis vinifera]|uniref:Tyrosine aminotransferase n=1 Tax=Vitis vinifera TaxID=29760 RepID=A0A438EGH0_VITVI|nr:Tyrosine aminotransferase [Vitis vinifera]